MSHHWNHILYCSCRLIYLVFWMYIWGSGLLSLIPFASWIIFPVRSRCSLFPIEGQSGFDHHVYYKHSLTGFTRKKNSPHLANSYAHDHIIAVSHDKSVLGFISDGHTVLQTGIWFHMTTYHESSSRQLHDFFLH